MKQTTRCSLSILALSTAALLSSGCSAKPSNADLTKNVQNKISSDTALKGQPISVATNDGTVTLTGTVGGEGTRELAARDASSVNGVRTVVNNLNVATAGTPPAESSTATPPPVNAPSNSPAPAQPAQPAAPRGMIIPAGTPIRIRLSRTLSSNHSQTGEPFSGTLIDSLRVNGEVAIRAGAQAHGTVTEAKRMGRFKGQAALALRLETLRVDGRTYRVRTSRIDRVEQGKGKRSAVMTGGGAGLGAIIGGLAGGGKGALIGGLLGGGGGAAGSAFTGNKDIVLPAETVLTFRLEHSVRVR